MPKPNDREKPLVNLTDTTPDSDIKIPVVEEELVANRRVVETGKIRATKKTRVSKQVVDTSVTAWEVEVKRVPIERVIEKPAVTREEGDVTIIPVVEEVVVVTKQLMLREEIHLIRHKREVTGEQEIALKKESVEIEKLRPDNDGGE